MEYVKGACEDNGELRDFCKKWTRPRTGYVPRPYPGYAKPGFHYVAARNTPVNDDDGNARAVDDYQPRVRLKELYKNSDITSSDEDEIKDFPEKYIVPENLVRDYVLHLEHPHLKREKRKREETAKKEAREEKTYEDYNWKELYESRRISSLQVSELDKYLNYHSRSSRAQKMKKKDKVSLVESHLAITALSNPSGNELEHLENDVEDNDDVVLRQWGTSQDSEDAQVFCLCRDPEDKRFINLKI